MAAYVAASVKAGDSEEGAVKLIEAAGPHAAPPKACTATSSAAAPIVDVTPSRPTLLQHARHVACACSLARMARSDVGIEQLRIRGGKKLNLPVKKIDDKLVPEVVLHFHGDISTVSASNAANVSSGFGRGGPFCPLRLVTFDSGEVMQFQTRPAPKERNVLSSTTLAWPVPLAKPNKLSTMVFSTVPIEIVPPVGVPLLTNPIQTGELPVLRMSKSTANEFLSDNQDLQFLELTRPMFPHVKDIQVLAQAKRSAISDSKQENK